MTATWTSPRTWATGDLATAAMLNQHLRDNLDWLKTPTAGTITWPTANFTTSSTSFVDITGLTTTITSNGGGFDVKFTASCTNSNLGAATYFDIMVDGVSISGVANGLQGWSQEVAGAAVAISFTWHIAAYSAGSHTIKMRARVSAGTLTIYGSTGGSILGQYHVVEAGN